jgi:hypothetical protein
MAPDPELDLRMGKQFRMGCNCWRQTKLSWFRIRLFPCFLFLISPALNHGAERAVSQVDPVAPHTPAQSYIVRAAYDQNGLPQEYSLYFQANVCTDGVCLPVKVTMHWDLLGNFDRLETDPGWPLTKKGHEPFTAEDHQKLDRILHDEDSALGRYTPDALARKTPETAWIWDTQPDSENSAEVDGMTGATPLTIRQSVVAGAAYTTWTLWWWANGSISEQLRAFTIEEIDADLLKHMLDSRKQSYIEFVLQYLDEHPLTDGQLIDQVFELLQDTRWENIAPILVYLDKAVQDRDRFQKGLAEAFLAMKSVYRPRVLEVLMKEEKLSAETLNELVGSIDQLSYHQLNLVLQLLERYDWFNAKTEETVAGLLSSEDFFIARRAAEFLNNRPLTDDTRKALDRFKQRTAQRQ